MSVAKFIETSRERSIWKYKKLKRDFFNFSSYFTRASFQEALRMDSSESSSALRQARPAVCSVSIPPSKDKQLPSTKFLLKYNFKKTSPGGGIALPSPWQKKCVFYKHMCRKKSLRSPSWFLSKEFLRILCLRIFLCNLEAEFWPLLLDASCVGDCRSDS